MPTPPEEQLPEPAITSAPTQELTDEQFDAAADAFVGALGELESSGEEFDLEAGADLVAARVRLSSPDHVAAEAHLLAGRLRAAERFPQYLPASWRPVADLLDALAGHLLDATAPDEGDEA